MTDTFHNKIKDNYFLLYPFVVLSYFGLGKISFYLTADSGFAALFWPSAAVALAFIMYFGNRVLPAIYIGALLSTITNTNIFFDIDGLIASSHNFVIAGGATLQAFIAGWVVNKLNLFKHDFSNPVKIGLFYLVAGPLCCLTSASVASLTFYLFGLNSFIDLFDEWLIWWIADSTSTIIFITFIFCITLFEKKRCHAIISTLIMGLLATFGIFYIGKQWENDRLNLLFDQEVISAVNILNQIEERQIALLKNLDNFVGFQSELRRPDFSRFALDNLAFNKTVRSLAWVQSVTNEERLIVEQELTEIHGRDIIFWERDANFNKIPALNRDENYYVRYGEPYDQYPEAIGFIVNSQQERIEALNNARETRDIVVTPPTLVSGTDGYLSTIIIYQAAFNSNEMLEGYSAILINLDTLMNEMLAGSAATDLEVLIRDINAPDAPTYSSQQIMDGFVDLNPVSVNVQMFDREWELTFRRTLEFNNRHKTVQPLYIGMAGMVFASLIAFGIVMLSGQRTYLEKQVADRTKELAHANDTKSQFMANMSHDLRTPLNAIIGFSEIMKQEMYGAIGDEKYKEYVKDINQSSEYLLSLINDILDYSAIEANKRNLEKEIFDPILMIEDCIRSLKPLIDAKSIVTDVALPPDFPNIYADQRSMMQIFINLISNSIKFTPDGGSITIHGHATINEIQLSVTDTGEGIDKSNIENILDPFTRVENHPHLSQEGSGLGLAIVNSLVKLHDGTLSIDSEFGIGTTVNVKLPRTPLE